MLYKGIQALRLELEGDWKPRQEADCGPDRSRLLARSDPEPVPLWKVALTWLIGTSRPIRQAPLHHCRLSGFCASVSKRSKAARYDTKKVGHYYHPVKKTNTLLDVNSLGVGEGKGCFFCYLCFPPYVERAIRTVSMNKRIHCFHL